MLDGENLQSRKEAIGEVVNINHRLENGPSWPVHNVTRQVIKIGIESSYRPKIIRISSEVVYLQKCTWWALAHVFLVLIISDHYHEHPDSPGREGV